MKVTVLFLRSAFGPPCVLLSREGFLAGLLLERADRPEPRPSSDPCESVETSVSSDLGACKEKEVREEELCSGEPNTSSFEESSGLFPLTLSVSLEALSAGGRVGRGLRRGEGEREGEGERRKGEGGLQVSSMCVVLRLEGGGEEMNLFLNLSELSGEGESSWEGVLSEESEDLLGFRTLTTMGLEMMCMGRGRDLVDTNSLWGLSGWKDKELSVWVLVLVLALVRMPLNSKSVVLS